MKGKLIIIAGPTAAGKDALVGEIIYLHPDQVVGSVSVTTRAPRPGEIEGKHYYFVDEAEFRRRAEAGEFLEWFEVHGQALYGTLKEQIIRLLEEGKTVIRIVDVQGALAIKKQMPKSVLVFILPPSEEELIRRFKTRGGESAESLEQRLQTAKEEIRIGKEKFEHVIVNDDFDTALKELEKIILG